MQLWDFSKGLKNEFETAVVNEPSKSYCILATSDNSLKKRVGVASYFASEALHLVEISVLMEVFQWIMEPYLRTYSCTQEYEEQYHHTISFLLVNSCKTIFIRISSQTDRQTGRRTDGKAQNHTFALLTLKNPTFPAGILTLATMHLPLIYF